MSFASSVQSELARVEPEQACCAKSELAALLLNKSNLSQIASDYILTVEVDNPALGRKIYKYLRDIYGFQSSVKVIEKSKLRKNRGYVVKTVLTPAKLENIKEIIHINNNLISPKLDITEVNSCCKRAYVRGLFLSRGYVNRPEGNYHLEFMVNDEALAIKVQEYLGTFDIDLKVIQRKKSFLLYIKESEQIADFLRVVGANKALLEFENIRILKSMRNNVNRQVNCETANLAKTIDASVRQTEIINNLVSTGVIDNLPYQLKELAYIRLDYPEATLKELGEILNPPLSKSGIAYRMRKLEQVAGELLDTSFN